MAIPDRKCGGWDLLRPFEQEYPHNLVASGAGAADPMGRNSLSMLESIPFSILIGTLLGFLAGLGVGGGSLLMLWLTLILGLPQNTARTVNLLFFIPSAIIASAFRWKQGHLALRKVLPAIIGGCISAACCALLSTHLDMTVLKKLFGGLLLFTGIRELFYKPSEK